MRILLVSCAALALSVGAASAVAGGGHGKGDGHGKSGVHGNAAGVHGNADGVHGHSSGVHGNSDAAHKCQKGGYKNWVRDDGTVFKNTGECVSYAAQGRTLSGADISLSYSAPTLTVSNAGPLAATVTVRVAFDCPVTVNAGSGWTVSPGVSFTDFTSVLPIPAAGSLTISVDNPSCQGSAEVTASDQSDPDSTPNNGVTTEDDYAVVPASVV